MKSIGKKPNNTPYPIRNGEAKEMFHWEKNIKVLMGGG
jgi:hypothetical protein